MGEGGAAGFTATSNYIYGADAQQLAEYDGSGNIVHENVPQGGNLLATYSASTSKWLYAFNDWLGTKRAQVGPDGSTNFLGFTSLPYGNNLSMSGVSATEDHFTGKDRDQESGNDYFGARYYSSKVGHMMSPDWSAKAMPVPYAKLDNPQTLNLYAYVGNNPLRFTDPTGHYLSGCAANDKGCNKGIKNFEKQRQKDLKSKDSNVRAGAASWGDKGVDNGVTVTFKTQAQVNADAGNTELNQTVNGFVLPGVTADHKPSITAEFSESRSGSDLAQTVAHEGTHIGDDLNFINSYNPATGTYNEGFNFSHGDAEFRAFEAGSGVKPYPMFSPGPSGYDQLQNYIWNGPYKDVANQPLFPSSYPTAYPQ